MLSVQEIIRATQGQMIHGYDNQVDIETIEFDSRKITKNSLFIPLKGQRDGHEFIQAAKIKEQLQLCGKRDVSMTLFRKS